MKLLKRIGLLLLLLAIAIQFVPVNRTNPAVDPNQDYLKVSAAPAEVARLLKASCYDCHSNEAKYPWYSYVAPVSFLIQNHIQEGRSKVNFSTWGSSSAHDQSEALEEIPETIAEGEMPLWDYNLMHPEAKLNEAEKQTLIDWFNQGGNSAEKSISKRENEHEGEHAED
ncbi:MAG TPA: heme-binding domain-containing protein [Haliscomenobacter sp.]|uniref:heme-binding domain-containing protein n=1 Tax=Haliscomenobacter sp. TaxID=2717303 RepID=UPI002C43C138|nr:heme-binding domain-containing protein [Haliscomenobacter sp.]HOY15660.1 heme-binding domain-containing protein [Haliscomenobacter sp.]